ncbi:hypothetical protein ACFWOJ_36035 [Streptomyces sp. NPDC058439]|uniref:hypothetical protein n=1 Tax=Streptomyces sp. NPDC058439 TaxID=3346500 RepID=UPI003657FF92
MVKAIRQWFSNELEAGSDVVLNHELRRRDERDAWQQTAREADCHALVAYRPASREELL